MSFRFWLESALANDQTELLGDQAHHAIHVMRMKVGDRLELFDGTGKNYQAEITDIQKKSLQLRILSTTACNRKLTRSITVAAAIPKGDRQRFLIEKLVELGIERFIPLKTQRSVVVANPNAIDRFRRWNIEACKQCQRDDLMEISQSRTPRELIAAFQNLAVGKLLAQPAADQALSAVDVDSETEGVIAIGPEGGFTDEELASFENAGWLSVSLSPFVLRIETAAIAAAAILSMK